MENTNFDAEKTMGELYSLIEDIDEVWSKRTFIQEDMDNRIKEGKTYFMIGYMAIFVPFFIFPIYYYSTALAIILTIVCIIGFLVTLPKNIEFHKMKNKFHKMKKPLEKEVNDTIKNEWNPRIKVIRKNVYLFSSDRELREAYNEFQEIDNEFQKITFAGRRKKQNKDEWAKMKKGMKFTALLTAGTVAVFAGGLHKAGRDIDKY